MLLLNGNIFGYILNEPDFYQISKERDVYDSKMLFHVMLTVMNALKFTTFHLLQIILLGYRYGNM